MSWGLVCLTCRRYVWHESLGVERAPSHCRCEEVGLKQRPSLDGVGAVTPNEVAWWWKHGHPAAVKRGL